MKQQKHTDGFTIVELLIVIVVIAILATITIIGFNGVQNRARNTTAQETASALQKKIEAYNAVRGSYPTVAAPGDGAALNTAMATGASAVPEAKLETSLIEDVAAAGTPALTLTPDVPVKYNPCPSGATKGGTINYWQNDGPKPIQLGAC